MALNFPAKIYLILENESSDIIKWHPNGLAFRIVDHGRFEREIIPKYFRHNQLSSVQRQLNLYGFKCINRGEDKGAFYHPRFKRGDWDVVKKITRYSPAKRSCDSPIFGPEKTVNVADNVECPPQSATNSAYSNSSIPDASFGFHQSSVMNHTAFVQQSYGIQFDSSSTNTPWYPTNIYGHLGYNIPMDFQHGSHFVSSFSTSTTVSSNTSSSMDPKMGASASAPVLTSTNDQASNGVKKDTHFEEGLNKHSFVNVINDVVLVDPYFDLDAEWDMFRDAGFSKNAISPRTCEIGINTDISQSCHNLSDMLQSFGTAMH